MHPPHILRIVINIKKPKPPTRGLTPGLEHDISARLAESEARFTKGRREVTAALLDADGPRSAAELHDVIGDKVPLSSLYRSLAVLEEAGVVILHFATKGLARYEPAEWLRGHHHHLVCIDCGAVEDVKVPAKVENRLETIVSEVATSSEFQPLDHALEIEGRCIRCA